MTTTPRATVRLQLHAGFTLRDACEQVPYYAALGISHFYTSPISRARPGSMHGYDVIDHSVVSPELGGEPALKLLVLRLREHGMGLILDIVPNHMATHPGNAWWWDVLMHGRQSAYASWFDIDWEPPQTDLAGKVLAPFLACSYGQALVSGDIRLVFDDAADAFQIDACGARYPVAPGSLRCEGDDPSQALAQYDSRDSQGQQRLHGLLERQHYRLSWWRCAADIINWRRFFEISELIGVRVERQQVFDEVHALPLRLFAEGLIDGLRVDHVDGLAEPVDYCRQLSQALRQRVDLRPAVLRQDAPWLIVEKILAKGETLGDNWHVDGTSGYDFMDQAAAVLHDLAGESLLTAHWQSVSGDIRPISSFVHDARRLMLQRHFVAERKGLLRALSRLARISVYTRDWTSEAIGRVLDALLTVFHVYRTYAQVDGRDDADSACFDQAMREAHARLDGAQSSEQLLLEMLDVWLGASPVASAPEAQASVRDLQCEAVRRFQQLTPPLAAKSLEDTVFYRYGRLLSRNEVGSDPAVLATLPETFHQQNLWRVPHAPRSLLATATHDHKRGEDVRARLAVLSEMPQSWAQASQRWLHWPGSMPPADGTQAGERYMLFQMLVGAWPLQLSADDAVGMERYAERIVQWQMKALREAKINSGWFEPDLAYEQQSADFVFSLMPGGPGHELLRDIAAFTQTITAAGAVNGLTQTLLRVCSPGVPDLYQGTEFWDFSLVDPDNRREVDYSLRQAGLSVLAASTSTDSLLSNWTDGRVKQAVLARALALRRELPDVFACGEYVCLPVLGDKRDHVLAFLRTWQAQQVVVVVPRVCSQGVAGHGSQGLPQIDPLFWNDTAVALPRRYIGAGLHDVLADRRHQVRPDSSLPLSEMLAGLPVALLRAG